MAWIQSIASTRVYFVSINFPGLSVQTYMDPWWMCGGATWAPSAPHRARAPLSVTSTAADGGRLVKGWALVNWAVKFNNISALFKTAKGFTCWSNSSSSRAPQNDTYTFPPSFSFFFLLQCQLTWRFWETNYFTSPCHNNVHWWRWDTLPDILTLTDIVLMTIPWIHFLLIGHAVGVMTGRYGGVCVCAHVSACPVYTAVSLVHLASTFLSGHLVTDWA